MKDVINMMSEKRQMLFGTDIMWWHPGRNRKLFFGGNRSRGGLLWDKNITLLCPVRLDFGFPVLLLIHWLLGEAGGHGGRLHHWLEAALALLDVLLRVEDDDVYFGHVEHPQRNRSTQAHGHSQGGCLDVHLGKGWVRGEKGSSYVFIRHVCVFKKIKCNLQCTDQLFHLWLSNAWSWHYRRVQKGLITC